LGVPVEALFAKVSRASRQWMTALVAALPRSSTNFLISDPRLDGLCSALLGNGMHRCHSLPRVALRLFLKGTRVSQNTTRSELLLSACARLPVVGDAVKAGDEVKFLMSKNYSWKLCYLQIILINIYQF